MGVRERQELSFRQASQARDDFAQITDLIRFVHEQTSIAELRRCMADRP